MTNSSLPPERHLATASTVCRVMTPSFLTRAGRWLPGGQRKSQWNRKQVGTWGQGRGCQARDTVPCFVQGGATGPENGVCDREDRGLTLLSVGLCHRVLKLSFRGKGVLGICKPLFFLTSLAVLNPLVISSNLNGLKTFYAHIFQT